MIGSIILCLLRLFYMLNAPMPRAGPIGDTSIFIARKFTVLGNARGRDLLFPQRQIL